MKILRFVITLVPVILAAGAVYAQNRHDREPYPRLNNSGRVSFEIHAAINLDSAHVCGSLEVDYRNLTSDPIRELVMTFSPAFKRRSGSLIDSVLVNGEPIPELRNFSAPVFRVPLAEPLVAKRSIHLYMSFVAPIALAQTRKRDCGVIPMVDWYPRVQPLRDSKWYVGDSTSGSCMPGEAADYSVALTIDTGWSAAATGMLTNEKEMYGLIRRRGDTVLTDLPRDSVGDPFAPSAYPRPGGKKSFAWKSLLRPTFEVVLVKPGSFDRVIVDSSIVDLYSCSTADENPWAESRGIVSRLLKLLNRWMGGDPVGQFAFISGARTGSLFEDPSPVLVGSPSSGQVDWLASQVLALATQWTEPVLSDTGESSSPIQAGVASYLAMEGINQMYPKQGYDACAAYADIQLGLDHSEYNPLGQGPFEWMNRVRKPRTITGQTDRRFDQLYRIPTKLHLVRQILGDSLFWNNLAVSMRTNNGAYLTESEFWSIICNGDDSLRSFVAGDRVKSVDVSLTDVVQMETREGITVSGKCTSNIPVAMTVRMACLVSSVDTVWQDVQINGSDNSRPATFSFALNTIPRAVILDPDFRYPDVNRTNNAHYFSMALLTQWSARDLFPGYRRLTLPR